MNPRPKLQLVVFERDSIKPIQQDNSNDKIEKLLEWAKNNIPFDRAPSRTFDSFEQAGKLYQSIISSKHRSELEEKFKTAKHLYARLKGDIFGGNMVFYKIRGLVTDGRITKEEASIILTKLFLNKAYGANSKKDKVTGSILLTNANHFLDIIDKNKTIGVMKLMNVISANVDGKGLVTDWVGNPQIKRLFTILPFRHNTYEGLLFIRDRQMFMGRIYGGFVNDAIRDVMRFFRLPESGYDYIISGEPTEKRRRKGTRVGKEESCCQIEDCTSCSHDPNSRYNPQKHHFMNKAYWGYVPNIDDIIDVPGNVVFLDVNKHLNTCHRVVCYLCYKESDDSVFMAAENINGVGYEILKLNYESQDHKTAQIKFIKRNGIRIDIGWALPNKEYWDSPEEKWVI